MIKNKRFLLSAFIILLLLTGVVGRYFYVSGSPEYCLNQLKTSIENSRIGPFKKSVGLNFLAGRIFDQRLAYFIKQNGVESGLEGFGLGSGLNSMDRVKSEAIQYITREIFEFVEQKDWESDSNKILGIYVDMADYFSLPKLAVQLGLHESKFIGFSEAEIIEDKILVKAIFQHKAFGKKIEIHLLLQRFGTRWRLIEIENFLDLIRSMEEEESSVKSSWQNSMKLHSVSLQIEGTNKVVVSAVVENIGDRPILSARLRVVLSDPLNQPVSTATYWIIQGNRVLMPGMVKDISFPIVISGELLNNYKINYTVDHFKLN